MKVIRDRLVEKLEETRYFGNIGKKELEKRVDFWLNNMTVDPNKQKESKK